MLLAIDHSRRRDPGNPLRGGQYRNKGEALCSPPQVRLGARAPPWGKMQINQHWQGLDPETRGASVAMGNFDGVHLGHQSVIDLARPHGPLGIVTFEPHPREYFAPNAPPFRLMNAEARSNRLAKLGVKQLFQLPFNADMASHTPEAFAREILAAGTGVAHVVVGADLLWQGPRRKGCRSASLWAALRIWRVTVPVKSEGREISSTAIRQALTDGRLRDAAAMLGHWHRIDGEVIHKKRGRELGYPTANMSVAGLASAETWRLCGESGCADRAAGGSHHGAASLGVAGVSGENTPNLETYIFDFKGDLYGHVSIGLIDGIRSR